MYFDQLQKTIESFSGNNIDPFRFSNPFELSQSLMENWQNQFNKSIELTQNNLRLFNDYSRLCQYTAMKGFGFNPDPVVEPESFDRRFSDEDWDEHIAFDHIKQFYLLASDFILDALTVHEHIDDKVNDQMHFFTKQWINALSPTNFASTNPTVLKETVDTHGQNLINGAHSLLEDFMRGKGKSLLTRMTDYSSFEVGKNVATTEGKVVYQNELMQLIQYKPTTKTVYEVPLLIIPPWINKYYILDLREENSFIKWAVDQGHTVFIISWKNPDESYADIGFEDYMLQGILTALDQVKKETGVNEANTIGYCIGGTLLAATNAYLATKRRKPIKTSTFFTTMVDFENPGDLGVFIDENQLKALDSNMGSQGYLDGTTMANVFNMLRANDLIWPFFINNYLLGKDPSAFDLLYWNSDSTRLPAKTHSFYLRKCYLENKLCQPGGIELDNTAIDLRKIKTPSYFISTKEDHITPWKSNYSGAKLFSGPMRFVLGGSGHIAGIINPPAKNKYGYWTNDNMDDDANTWLEKSEEHEGSWWPDWQKWVARKSGKKIPARKPGQKLKVIEDAPGSYVKERIIPE